MKITKYPQSCLKLEYNERALLIDVGNVATAAHSLDEFGEVDAVLFTHSHPDHFDVTILPELSGKGVPCYGNADVGASAAGQGIEVIEDGEELVIADFKIKALHLEHSRMVDGAPGVPNTGYLINDRLLIPGDSTVDPGISCDIVAVPIFGPDISFHDAFNLIRATKAAHAILIHYDIAGMKPETFSLQGGDKAGAAVHALASGQSVELTP